MQPLLRLSIPVALACACNTGERPQAASSAGSAGSADSRAQCAKVRDHLVELIANAYAASPETTFDGLDRSDPQITEGLDTSLTRETFAAFLATDTGKAWLERQKARAISAPAMAATVDKCALQATQAHLDCWLGATDISAFQLCPAPGS